MAQRHRTRSNNPEHGQRRLERRILTGTVEAVPAYPATSRPGLDSKIFIALKAVDNLIRDMRIGIDLPSDIADGENALRSYLLHLSVLVDVVLADIGMSALNRNDLMVRIKLRMLVEYAAKAAYFDDHRDYALWMMTIGEARQTLRKLRDADSDIEMINAASQRLADLRTRFPQLSHFERPEKIGDMIRLYGTADDAVWLYNAPSALMHGDPEGFRAMMDLAPEGGYQLRIELPLEEVNAMLVDAGRNTLMFCDRFIGCFRAGDNTLVRRYKDLYKSFLDLLLTHPAGRDADALEVVRREFEML